MSEHPEGGERQQLLRDGFWEETAVYRRANGAIVVRKASKPSPVPAPWALETLKREIGYLRSLPPGARPFFPELQQAWGAEEGAAHVGYEIPFYENWHDGRAWLTTGPGQEAVDVFQCSLAEILFERLHVATNPADRLGRHVEQTIRQTVAALEDTEEFGALMRAPHVCIDEEPVAGFVSLLRELPFADICDGLDASPQVRLHGDLILENILVRASATAPRPEDLKLIDPVSVAGISEGHPFFDLVKYESYATGDLLALRSGWVNCSIRPTGPGLFACRCRMDAGHPELRPFRRIDAVQTFRTHFESRYGRVDETLYHVLDAYFSLVMAMNTFGGRRQVRVLRALQALNRSLRGA